VRRLDAAFLQARLDAPFWGQAWWHLLDAGAPSSRVARESGVKPPHSKSECCSLLAWPHFSLAVSPYGPP